MPSSAPLLQARVDAETDPRLSLLSRLAFHWAAAHDVPRALAASLRAGEAATRLGAAEGVTHLERALSLWARVPDAAVVTGLHQIELHSSAGGVGRLPDRLRAAGTSLVRRSLDMLRPDTEPLLASRVYSLLAYCSLFHEDPIGSSGGHPTGA